MDEMKDEYNRLERAANLLREHTAARIPEAVGIIEDVISELRGHDCDDFASECDCEPYVDGPDLRGVTECLAFGLPQLVEKYGLNSEEAKLAERLIEGARV